MAWRSKFFISYLLFWKLEGRGRTGQPSRLAFGVLQRFVRAGAGGWRWGAELPGLSGLGGGCSALAFLQAQRAGAPRPGFGASFSFRQGLALTREKPLLQTHGWSRPEHPGSALPALSQTCPEAHPSRRRFPQGGCFSEISLPLYLNFLASALKTRVRLSHGRVRRLSPQSAPKPLPSGERATAAAKALPTSVCVPPLLAKLAVISLYQ